MKDERPCRLLPTETGEEFGDYILAGVTFGVGDSAHIAVLLAYSQEQQSYAVAMNNAYTGELENIQIHRELRPAALDFAGRSAPFLRAYAEQTGGPAALPESVIHQVIPPGGKAQ